MAALAWAAMSAHSAAKEVRTVARAPSAPGGGGTQPTRGPSGAVAVARARADAGAGEDAGKSPYAMEAARPPNLPELGLDIAVPCRRCRAGRRLHRLGALANRDIADLVGGRKLPPEVGAFREKRSNFSPPGRRRCRRRSVREVREGDLAQVGDERAPSRIDAAHLGGVAP